jgi:hypothetical protein
VTNEENILIATVLGGHRVATGSDGAHWIVNLDGSLSPVPDFESDWAATVILAQELGQKKKVEWEMGGGDGRPWALVDHFRSYAETATTALAYCLLSLAKEWS